ncbi:G-type lectin S-receptor-like serine/threonine-protein kinase SD2-5 isoform X1 [Setaria viridis]|nr:G-type lectin S-receptor-like serine/threonine-protein kinase SD2-5 isoform X1 [Setaria viridis]XP_034598805.1 G-type lectin S-receptor-like serine/threonine-protein kinase SD2-5 isoform X1 [Setaria viridis]
MFSLVMITFTTIVSDKRRHHKNDDDNDFSDVAGMPTRLAFKLLKVATQDFSNKLGQGEFGSVYEGQLDNERVAVKCLDRAGQGKKDFLAEVQTIGSLHHINLVRLIGFCSEKSYRLLVFEYMPRGSLDKWIYQRDKFVPLEWHTRRKIINDIARGLSYLHEECRQRIAHLDIKPQNILLDENFNAKISDFELSKLIDRGESHVMTRMRGTPGYMAPEWLTSQITEKVDVCSFGIVVMEIISGRKNLDYSQHESSVQVIIVLQDKAKNDLLEDMIDRSSDDMSLHKEDVIETIKLARWCLQSDKNRRPAMSMVVKDMEGERSVESNLDYNFFDLSPAVTVQVGESKFSDPPVVSVLYAPR